MRPRLFLDIDGTVNAFQPTDLWPEYRATRVQMAGIVQWSPNLIQSFRDLNFDLYWATMWLDMAAPLFGRAIGYGEDAPHLEPLPGTRPSFPTILWKRESVEAFVTANPGPFAWLDDEMRPEDTEWARSVGGIALLSDESQGITPAQIELIKEHLAQF